MIASKILFVARWASDAAVRALAVFALANVLLGLFSARWNANDLWVQGGAVEPAIVQGLVLVFAVGVLFLRRVHPAAALAVRGVAVLLAIACLADAFLYFRLLADGRIATSLPVPLSLLLGLLLMGWAGLPRAARATRDAGTRRALWIRVLDHSAPLALLGLGVLLHLLTFGATDYARPADAAVVFGAAVRPDGQASLSLHDRTVTACDLYHRGLVHTLVLSGGRDPRAPLSEPACMAAIARAQGVPAEALVLDEQGVDTAASLQGAARLAARHGWQRLLMVSHDYHLARISLDAGRRGLRAQTVPARESRPLWAKPWFVAREVLAWGLYFVRPPRS